MYQCNHSLYVHKADTKIALLDQNTPFLLVEHYPPDALSEVVMIAILGEDYLGSICIVVDSLDTFEFTEIK